MSVLLCDIGGTHVRFAIDHNGLLSGIEKYRADQFEKYADALHYYLKNLKAQPKRLYLATAAIFDGEKLVFTNSNSWSLKKSDLLSEFAFEELIIVNDFEANALGVAEAEAQDLQAIAESHEDFDDKQSRCVIGVGTGLGLAYLVGNKKNPLIQQTYGGHMLPVTTSEKQRGLFAFLQQRKKSQTVSIYEDALSGEGLYQIYLFECAEEKAQAEYESIGELLRHGGEDRIFAKALDLFCEILGLFAHQAVAFGFSYNGLYLTGGIIDRLMDKNLFNIQKFLNSFYQNNIAIVQNAVKTMPVYWIKNEFISLKGLLHFAEANDA